MHVVHYYQHTKHKRTRAEKLFKRLNTFIFAVQLACVIFSATAISSAINMTVEKDKFQWKDDVRIRESLLMTAKNCSTYSDYRKMIVMTRGSYRYNIEINEDNFSYLMVELLIHAISSLIACSVALFFGFINKAAFEFNKHEWIIRSINIYKTPFTVMEFIAIIYAFITINEGESLAEVMQAYLKECTTMDQRKAFETIPFVFPFITQYIALGNTLLWHLITAAIAVRNGMKKCILDELEVTYDEYGNPIALRTNADKDKYDDVLCCGGGEGVVALTNTDEAQNPNTQRICDVGEGARQELMRSYAVEHSARKRMMGNSNDGYYMPRSGFVSPTQVEMLIEHNQHRNRLQPTPRTPFYQPREINQGVNTDTAEVGRYNFAQSSQQSSPLITPTNNNDQMYGKTTRAFSITSNYSQGGNGATTNYTQPQHGVSPSLLQPQRRRPPPPPSVYNDNPFSATGTYPRPSL
eukprot:Tbor_TRINITY_DN4932_c0_g1::TRINITY_DN4932_c0_g1_i1::g.9971::m.9971